MIRGTITGCSGSLCGGAIEVFGAGALLLDVMVADCQITGDKDGGGAIGIDDSRFIMRGGAIRNCEAPNANGGALRVAGDGSQVELSGVTVHGCSARRCGFLHLLNAGTVRLVDVSIEDCEASVQDAVMFSTGTVHAERVRVVRPGVIRFALNLHGISSWTDCIFSDFVDRGATNKQCFSILSGTHTFTRTSITNFPTAISTEGVSVTTMLDSHILDCPGHRGPALDISCLHFSRGTLVLRNTTLHNCGSPQVPAWIFFSADSATNFRSELLTLEPSCDEDPSTALISIDSTFTEPLNARGLRVVVPAACPSSTFSVFRETVRLMNCSDGDGDGICGAAATCTDVQPLPSVPDLTTASCSCEGEVFANPNGTSLALAPYGFDPSAIGLPVSLDRTSVGLPDTTIDYCVRAVLFKPQPAAQICVRPHRSRHRSHREGRCSSNSAASFWKRYSGSRRMRPPTRSTLLSSPSS